jgi:hypothetical protein
MTTITKRDLNRFLRQINTLEELSEGGIYREDWWSTTRNVKSRVLYNILKAAAARYDALTATSNKGSRALTEYLKQEDKIRKRLLHELKHAPKGTDLVALANGIEAEERGDSQPIESSFKEFREGIRAV